MKTDSDSQPPPPNSRLFLLVLLGTLYGGHASAQKVLGSFFPSPASWFDSSVKFVDPRPFGADQAQLPGERITQASKLRGKWYHRQLQRNVELDHVRVPQLFTSLLIDLQNDGSYTLEYEAIWGGASGAADSRYASLEAHEEGRFALSGGVLLLEATAIDVTRSGKGGEQRESSANQRRAYLVRLDRSYLNLAGACGPYQAEEVCKRNRNVWFSLPQLRAVQTLPKR